MISVPCAVHNDYFKWQLQLFWYNHKKVYGGDAYNKAHAIIIKRNEIFQKSVDNCEWNIDVPHTMCDPYFDYDTKLSGMNGFFKPMNIQIGLKQIIKNFDDEEVLEILDCDMFHLKPAPMLEVGDSELYVCDLYENWHLQSLSYRNYVIAPLIQTNHSIFYNGGFVPIIGKVKTLKKILNTWIDVHTRIVVDNKDDRHVKWWAGMYALQVACQNREVQMKAFNGCYIPNLNTITPDHYIVHYSVDPVFKKSHGPYRLDCNTFPDNVFYNAVKEWKESLDKP